MSLIIDGYNLLHVAGVFGRGRLGGKLQNSREALLRFLAASLDLAERHRTTIVFDAAEAPSGLPQLTMHAEMKVLYAANYEDADALIEELIAADFSPRTLMVVSSDHRIQRAARRRRARFCDSDLWFADLVRERERRRRRQDAKQANRPSGPLNESEVAYWLAEFDVVELDVAQFDADAKRRGAALHDERAAIPKSRPGDVDPKKVDPAAFPLENPFPPGYADDLLEEED